MRKTLVFSVIMHLALVTLAYFGVPMAQKELVVGSEPVAIEIVSVAEKTNLPPPRPTPQPEKPAPAARVDAKPQVEPLPKANPKPRPPATPEPESAEVEPLPETEPPAQAQAGLPEAKPQQVREPEPQQAAKAEAQPPPPSPTPPTPVPAAPPQPDKAVTEQRPVPQPSSPLKPAPQREKPAQNQASSSAAVAENKPARAPSEPKPAPATDFQSVLKTVNALEPTEPQKPVAQETAPNKAATEAKPAQEKPNAKNASPPPEPSSEKAFASLIEQALGPNTAPAGASASGRTYDPAQPMTISEIDEVRRQIERCWNIPAGARDAGDHVVTIRVEMSPDATPRSASVVNEAAMRGNSFQRAAAESALRAVLNPRCHPFKLPVDKYDHWKTMTLVFNPKDMLGT